MFSTFYLLIIKYYVLIIYFSDRLRNLILERGEVISHEHKHNLFYVT